MVAISDAMATALQAYRLGNLVQAEWLCYQILEQRQTYVPALHLLGAIALQTSRLESAIAHYQTVLALEPSHFEAHSNLAVALQDRGDWEMAAKHFQRSLALNPNHAPTHFNAGNLALKQTQFEQAIAHYQQAIALNPLYAKAYTNLGNALREQGKLAAAIAHYQQVVALTPHDAQAYNNLGSALQTQEQFEAALTHYQNALNIQRHAPEVHFNLANVLRLLDRAEEAIVYYQQAIALDPSRAEFYNNLGITLQDQQKPEAAIVQYQQAIALDPTSVESYSNLGSALYQHGDFEGAIKQCQTALSLDPQFAHAHFNQGMALLGLGRWRQGFAEYEWRLQCQEFRPPEILGTRWDGSALQGKTILLYGEQGFGDSIHFMRYVPLVAEQFQGRVVVACDSELLPLFAGVTGIAQLISKDEPLPPYDVYALLMSLPHVMSEDDSVLAQTPYLTVPDRPLVIPDRSSQRLKIGIAWASGLPKVLARARSARNRTASLPVFMALQSVPNVSLYSLQVGHSTADIAAFGYEQQLHDLSHQLHDFADTAAAIDQVDLILSVDTAVAHLAGALAKPVWVVLPFAGDWRWLLHREDSPWYPTMRLFRQPAPGDWDGVMVKVLQALGERLEHEQLS